MDNLHRPYIVVYVEFQPKYILYKHHQYILVNIYSWQHDYQLGIERLAHNCMDLDNVHSNKPNGMDNHCLLYTLDVHKQSMDFHDIRLSNSIVHDDYNLIYRLHCDRIEFDHKLQRNYDLHMPVWLDSHYQHGIQLKRKEIYFFRMIIIFDTNKKNLMLKRKKSCSLKLTFITSNLSISSESFMANTQWSMSLNMANSIITANSTLCTWILASFIDASLII